MTTKNYINVDELPDKNKSEDHSRLNVDDLPDLKKKSGAFGFDSITGLQKVPSGSGVGSKAPASSSTSKSQNPELLSEVISANEGSPVSKLPETQPTLAPIHIEEDHEDPIKAIAKPFREMANTEFEKLGQSGRNNRQVSESTQQANYGSRKMINESANYQRELTNNALKTKEQQRYVEDVLNSHFFEDGNKAKEYIANKVATKGALDKSNETDMVALKNAERIDAVQKDLGQYGSITMAAIAEKAREDPNFKDQLDVIRAAHNDLPEAVEGAAIAKYLYNHANDIKALGEKDQFIKDDFEYLGNNLLTLYPEFGTTVVANKVSRERERRGLNSAVANLHTQKFEENTDKIADEILEGQEKQIYDEYIKNNKKKYIDVGGFVNRFEEGIEHGFESSKGSMRDLLGTNSKSDILNSELTKQYGAINSGEKGWKKAIGVAGDFGGTIAYMVGTGNLAKGVGVNPMVADKAVTALTFYDDFYKQGVLKYPEDNAKAKISAIANTLAIGTLSNIFPASKVSTAMGKIAPKLEDVIKTLGGDVSSVGAKDQLAKAFKEGITQYGKGIAEMTAFTIFGQGLDKALGLKNYKSYHGEDEVTDVIKAMAAGNFLPSVIVGAGKYKSNKANADIAYDIASNPKRYSNSITNSEIPETLKNEIVRNIYLLRQTKETLDQHGITEPNQKAYLAETMNEIAATKKASPESAIKRKNEEQVKRSEEIKERILNGENADEIITEADQKVIDKKNEAKTEIESLTKKQEFDNKEFDVKIKALDPESETYTVKKQKLKQAQREKNQEYDDKIEQLSDEHGIIDVERATKKELVAAATKAIDTEVPEYLRESLKIDVVDALKEAAEQLNSTKVERETARKMYGDTFSDIALKMFPDAKTEVNPEGMLAKHNAEQAASEKSSVSVTMPGEIPKHETTTIAPKENVPDIKPKISIILPKQNEIKPEANTKNQQGDQPAEEAKRPDTITDKVIEGTGAGQNAPGEGGAQPPVEGLSESESGAVANGITHAANEVRRVDRALPEYQKTPETFEEWNNQAEKLIKKGYAIDKLMDKIQKGHDPTPVENAIRKIYIATLDAEIEKNPTDALLAKQKRFIEVGDLANSRAGRNLVSLKGEGSPMSSISDFYVAKMEAAGVNRLTTEQKEQVKKSYKKVKETQANESAKIKEFEQRGTEEEATKEVTKMAKEKKPQGKKNFVSERQSLKDKLKAAREEHIQYLKDQGIQKAGFGSFTVKEAKIVTQIVKSYVDEGVTKLAEVVDKVFDEIKGIFPDATKDDVRDVIAGKYNEKKETRNELAAKMRDLKDEQIYIEKLDKLLKGEEPKDESKKVKRNQAITDLQNKIKEFKKEDAEANRFAKEEFEKAVVDPDAKKLEQIKKRNEKQQKEIQEKIKNGDFEAKPKKPFLEDPELKKKYPQLYKETLDAIIKKEEARHEYDIALLKDQMSRRSKIKKTIDIAGAVLATSRAVVTGIDASGVGIQNLVAMIAHPRSAKQALPESFLDFASAKTQERWLASVHSSQLYPLAKKAGLDITEPQSLKSAEKEEIFTNNLLDKTIQFKGKKYQVGKYLTKPFERIFVGLGNRMRWNLWARGVEKLQDEGYSFESHPEEYKSLANILNTETGRGKLHEQIDKAYGLISSGIWSPRLMASRLNILGLGDVGNFIAGGKKGYYGGLTPKMRMYAIKDVAKFIAFGTILMGAAAYTFADDVDFNPNSSTFGTIAVDGKRYNIWGGFTGYVRLIAKLAMGGEKSGGEFRKSTQASTLERFFWGKETPVAGVITDLTMGHDYMGKPVTFKSEGLKLIAPLSIRGIVDGLQKEGIGSILWTGVPSFIGMNVSYESDFQNESSLTSEEKKDTTFKYFIDKGVKINQPNASQIEIEDKDGKTIKKLSDYKPEKQKKFQDVRKKYLKEELRDLKDRSTSIYVDSYGRASLPTDPEDRRGKDEISVDKLSEKQLKEVIGILGDKATKKAKEEVFYND